MNNYVFLSNETYLKAVKKHRFMMAQARVAVPLFIMLGISLGCSIMLMIAYRIFPDMFENTIGYEITEASMYLAYMAIPTFTFGLISGKKITSYFAVRRTGRHGFALFLFGLGIIYFGQYVAVIISNFLNGAGVFTPAGEYGDGDIGLLIFRIIYIAVFPAILEEFLTRGVILGELLPYGKGFAIVVSGALFAFMHMDLVQFPFAFLAGIAMAYVAVSYGSLRIAVLIHFANNFISVLFSSLPAFIPEEWCVFMEATVSALIFIGGISAAIYLMLKKDNKDVKRKALCANVNEEDKIDLRVSPLKNISPLLYVYAAVAVTMAIVEAVLSNI